MFISNSGTSISTVSGAGAAPVINGADYYGVDVTWFTGGSFTRPIFDLANTKPSGTNGTVITTTGTNITLDDIEIKRSLQPVFTNGGCTSASLNISGSSNIVIDRLYIHDWTITTLADLDGAHQSGSICGAAAKSGQNVYNTVMSDQNTSVTTPAALPFGTCYDEINGEVAYNTCEFAGEGLLFVHGSFHDNQVHDLDGSPVSAYTSPQVHSNGYESDGFPADFYNNLLYNLNIDFNSICASSKAVVIYNNVIWNSKVANIAIDNLGSRCQLASATSQAYVYNNTLDGASTYSAAHGTITTVNRSAGSCTSTCNGGNVHVTNNVTATAGFSFTSSQYVVTQTTNHQLTSVEVATYGWNAANKYAPSSSDPSTVGQATNLTSSATGSLAALLKDASGAPWFGGAYKNRPTGSTAWDMGAYVQAGGTTGPPTVTITSPSAGTVSGTQTLTATCTPQGAATCTSVQFTIDGFPFGAPDTSSPYTTSWNTATAANANHVIGATATDSNLQTGTAGTVAVTVNNSIPGCFISTDNAGTTPLSWTANQAFTPQSANFSPTVIVAPWTANQNTVFAFSQNPMGAYTDGAALLRANSSGVWDAWNDTVGNYAAVNSAPYSAATAYSFTFTINFTGANAGTYNISETSPSSIVIATNYAFRSTALIASLGYINSIAVNDTPDTQKVCNFLIAPTSSLTFSPVSLNFGNVVVSSGTPTLTDTVTSSGGSTTFTSVAITGNADFTINSNGCTGSQTSCTTVVKFAPTATGVESATLTYTDNATGSPQTVAITGTGIASPSSATPSPTSVNLGNVQLNLPGGAVSGPVIVALTNGPVTFDSTPVTFDNPDFSVASNTCNGSVSTPTCQTTVRFIPSSLSNETATMTYHDNAPSGGSTQTVALVGSGVNFPTPAPATQFVWNGSIPIQVTVKGKTFSMDYPTTCTCNLVNSQWSCQCQ
jgi:hypothetical protein